MLSSLLRDVGRIPDVGVLGSPSDGLSMSPSLVSLPLFSLPSSCASRSLTTSKTFIFSFTHSIASFISIFTSKRTNKHTNWLRHTYQSQQNCNKRTQINCWA